MQGHRRRRETQRSSATSIRGFTLIEVMLSLVLLMVTSMALLQGLELAFRHYALAQNRWKASVELWNQIEKLRATHSPRGEPLQIIPDSRPLYRTLLTDPRLGEHSGWEVLNSEK
ncbi:MAG: prepilin-type N-terminal cleavage/methylation domain-containing protein [Acidobacteriota bacterium]